MPPTIMGGAEMRRGRFLCIESLEQRRLLSRAHLAAHVKPAIATTALVLTGNLAVDNHDSTTTEDEQGDVMTSTPVAGQLGAIGEVRGVWNTATDQFGDYIGPDSLRLRTANGSFVVQFSEQNTAAVHHLKGGAIESVHPQLASDGTGAYARTREKGTIELATNAARTVVGSITLTSQGK
jgi:hypothetical protein